MHKNSNQKFHSPEVKVVEASAGSGKTYALAKRYLQLIFSLSYDQSALPIRSILALTFTNKAAIEMKTRILVLLKKIAFQELKDEALKDILGGLNKSQEKLSLQAKILLEEMIHDYNFFQVQTIDKFINSLLCGCAFKIKLTSNFRIKTNASDYLEYCIDRLVDQGQTQKEMAGIFKDFLHNYLYLENRSGWFPKEDILSIIIELFHQNNSYGSVFQTSSIAPEDIFKTKTMILEEMNLLNNMLPDNVNASFAKGLKKFLGKHIKGFDVDSLSDYFMREDVPLKKDREASDEIQQIWSLLRLNITKLCEQESSALFDPYIRIFTKVLEEFIAYTSQEDILFLGELNKKARSLFDEEFITVEELYYRLATRFHHYLIDEFQDTSQLQWKNLNKMVEEALSTGGTLFYVGDKKQAIYSFRGGNVELFENVKKGFSQFHVTVDQLTKNWRSQKAIVELNNNIFSLNNLNRFIDKKEAYDAEKKRKNAVTFTQRDRKSLEDVFQEAVQTFKDENDKGYVQIEYIDSDKKEERNKVIQERLIPLIKELQGRFSLSEIAILTRGNTEVEEVTSWLLEEGILVHSERTSNIQENGMIKELVAFLKFLNSPIDNVFFAQFLLGDIFHKASGLNPQKMHDFIFSLRSRMHKEKGVYLYIEFRKKYQDLWEEYFEEFFRNVGLYPLYELLISIYARFQITTHFNDSQGFFMHFLEIVKKQEEDHADMASFLEFFENMQGEELYVQLSHTDAVKIMTIHKSKGLEFPVVILPFLGMDIQVGSSGGDNQQSYILQQKKEHIELLRLKSKYLGFSDNLYQVYRQEYKKAFLSELNSVYVALTRPVYELYAFIPKRIGNSFNILKFLIPEDHYTMGQQVSYPKKEQSEEEILTFGKSNYCNWIEFLKEEFLSQEGIVSREKIKEGSIFHYVLSFIENVTHQDMQQVLSEVINHLRVVYPKIEEPERFISIVEKLVQTESLKPFFFLENAHVFTEKEVVNAYGDTKRIDRIIVKDKEVWVVDYKLSKEKNDHYQEQVSEYVDMISKLYKGYKVKGFLIYINECQVEEVHNG